MIQLNTFKRNVYSQGGEDGIIDKIFSSLDIRQGNYVEIGADDGMEISNTRLLREKGWKGVLIEGSSRFIKLQDNVKNAELVNKYVSCEDGDRMDDILAETSLPKDFEFMSLDIDGNDLWVWESMVLYRPLVMCVEYNYTLKESLTIAYNPDHRFNNDNYYGATAAAFCKLAKDKGYDLIAFTPFLNLFFIDKDQDHPFQVLNPDTIPTGKGWKQSERKMVSY